MSYAPAINKAWEELANLGSPGILSVKFLADEYTVDTAGRKVMSLACNVPANDFTTILILHYIIGKANGLPILSGEWFSFKELSGVEGYLPTFKKRSIEPVIRKYGTHPEGLLDVLVRLPGKRVDQGDVGLYKEHKPARPIHNDEPRLPLV